MSEFTSWNTISKGLSNFRSYSKRLFEQGATISGIHSANTEASNQLTYNHFLAGIGGLRGRIGGPAGKQVDSVIQQFLNKLEAGGGHKIEKGQLSTEIADFRKEIGRIASSLHGVQGEVLRDFTRDLKEAKEKTSKGGIAALGSGAKDAVKAAFGIKADNSVEDARREIASEVRKAAKTLADPTLKQSITQVVAEMHRLANAAKNTSEKQNILANVQQKLARIARGASGADRTVLEGLASSTGRTTDELQKSIKGQTWNRRGLELNNKISHLTHAIGGVTRYVVPIKRSLDVGNIVFQAVNSKFNQFARMQMRVSAERGGYGRQVRGAGINYGHMMSAIGAGRSAGMDDRQVVGQMVNLQSQLAEARWGEGGLIEKAGRWGISVYNSTGEVKQAHELMIDFSRKLRSLGSNMEKLQFLNHIGRRPEEMEYVANYEAHAKRMEFLKKNPHLQSILDKADILDESGFNAKVDAATKIELRRREILNQNAIEQGPIAALMRSLSPENWLFSEWTARKTGVENVKSEQAQERLVSALREFQNELKKGNDATNKNTAVMRKLSASDLMELSFTSGWAEQDIANYGTNSQVFELSKDFAKRVGGLDPRQVDKSNRERTAAIGTVIGGAVGTGIALALAPFTGGLSILAALAAGGAGAYVGGATGYQNPLNLTATGREDLYKRLRNARTQEEIDSLIGNTAIHGLTLADVKSAEFQTDEGADKIAQGRSRVNDLAEAQKYVTNGAVVSPTQTYKNKYASAAERAIGPLSSKSKAVMMAYNVDPSIRLHHSWYQHYVEQGPDFTDASVQKEVAKHQQAIIQEHKDWDFNRVQTEAMRKVSSDFEKNLTTEERRGYIQSLIEKRSKGGASSKESIEIELQRKRARLAALEEEYKGKDLVQLATEETDPAKMSWWEGMSSWQNVKDVWSSPVNSFIYGTGEHGSIASARAKRAREARELMKLRNELNGKTDSQIIENELRNSSLEGLSQEAKERKVVEELYGEGGRFAGQKRMYSEMFGWEKKETIKRLNKLLEKDEKSSAEKRLTLMALEGKSIGMSKDDVANDQLTDQEVAKIEKKIAEGKKPYWSERRDYEVWKLGSKYKAREAAKAKAKEKENGKGKNVEPSVDDDIARIFKGGKPLENGNEQSPASEIPAANTNEEKPKEGKATETKDITRHDIAVMKKARALGYDLSKGFSEGEIGQLKDLEKAQKELFISKGLGSSSDYEIYRELEDKQLKGETITDSQKEFVEQTNDILQKAKIEKKYEPLTKPYKPTKEEQADIDASDRESARLMKENEIRERQIAKGGRQPLAVYSDLRYMDSVISRGGIADNDKVLEKHFGRDRVKQYREAQRNGIIDALRKGSHYKDAKMKKRKGAPEMSREEAEANFRSMAEANFKKKDGETDEEYKKRIDAKVAANMELFDTLHPNAKKKAKEEKKKPSAAAIAAGIASEDGKSAEDKAESTTSATGAADAAKAMAEAGEKTVQASKIMSENSDAAEKAAASGNAATSASGGNIEKNITVNVAGSNITQNINDIDPKHAPEMKRATQEGVDDVLSKCAQTVSKEVLSPNTW